MKTLIPNHEGCLGHPAELYSEHLLNWSNYVSIIERTDVRLCDKLPLGYWMWDCAPGPYRDRFMAKLESCAIGDIYDDPVRLIDYEWYGFEHKVYTYKEAVDAWLKNNIPLMIVYRDSNSRLIMRSPTYVLEVCRRMGITSTDCFVIDTKDGFAKNRTFYLQEAIKAGSASENAATEYASLDFPISAPLMCPNYSDQTLAYTRMFGQNTRQRLEAILSHLAGDTQSLLDLLRDEASHLAAVRRV